MNFSIEVAKLNVGQETGSTIAEFRTNSVLELAQYIGEAVAYFQGMIKFDSNVEYVGLLIRCYRDHHVVSIQRDGDGNVRVSTSQR